jgi:3-phytase
MHKQLVIIFLGLVIVNRAFTINKVVSDFETDKVVSIGDAADDLSFWINSKDPLQSLIIATDKKFGLITFDFNGKKIGEYAYGKLNNIDGRDGFTWNNQELSVFVGSNRSTRSLDFFTVNPEKLAIEKLGQISTDYEPYGICVGMTSEKNQLTVFVPLKNGQIERWLINLTTNMSIIAKQLKPLKLSSKVEGCVYDEKTQQLFVSEEAIGLWSFNLTEESPRPVLVDGVDNPNGHIQADVEGVSIFRGIKNTSLLVVSCQGTSSFSVYEVTNHKYLGNFQIGSTDNIDEVTHTDGLDILAAGKHPSFPAGLLVVQDGLNTLSNGSNENQNFKGIDWRKIEIFLALYHFH